MYFMKIGELFFLRCTGLSEKVASSQGLLAPESVKRYSKKLREDKNTSSHNPILRGIPATSARQSSPLVVTLGTSGV
jgi:hypothetical protein